MENKFSKMNALECGLDANKNSTLSESREKLIKIKNRLKTVLSDFKELQQLMSQDND